MGDIRIIVPVEWSNDDKGNFFEEKVGELISTMRYKVIKRIRFTGMELDLLASNKDNNQLAFIECKFKLEKITGPEIANLMGKAYIENADLVYFFSTSEPGKEAKGVIYKLEQENKTRDIKFSFIGPDKLYQMYLEVHNIPPLTNMINNSHISPNRVGNITLLITTEGDYWIVEHIEKGMPDKLYIFPIDDKQIMELRGIRDLLTQNNLFLDLVCNNGPKWLEESKFSDDSSSDTINDLSDTISQIPMADQFDDYRPCNPQDFIGRRQLQKDIWDFFQKVLNEQTSTRIISLIGQSGFGKSSLILKLSDRFRNIHWKNKYYLYHVDTRSASSSLFIIEAIRKGFNEAIIDGFIPIDHEITIKSIDSMFSSESLQSCFKYLRENKKLLIIFFDQFEELFVKEELFHVFENFKRLSFEIDDLQENIIIGCSWRTGISLPEGHPAYHMWQELRDRRKEFWIEQFDGSEISQQIQLC